MNRGCEVYLTAHIELTMHRVVAVCQEPEILTLIETPARERNRKSFQLARDCGIPFVVFISDACRSTPQSLKADRVRCSLIFPNDGVSGQKRAKIDWLFACGPGNPAYEVTVDASSKQYAELFTSCLRKAFEDPPHERTKKTGSDEVLPNNALEELLPKMVDAVAQILSISLHRQAAGALRGVPGI